jgi:hypothetical protein
MSRTYRRRRYRQYWNSDDPLLAFNAFEKDIVWQDVDYIKEHHCYTAILGYTVKYKKGSKTGRKMVAIANSDAATIRHKEPGPGWFRTESTQAPYRRRARDLIQQYLNGTIEDVVLESMPYLEYWT